MGRRKKDEGESVSLFPFMSILVCLIGSLTLMITTLMATQTNSEQDQSEVERYIKYSEVQTDLEAQKKELAELQELLAAARRIREELDRALSQVIKLESDQKSGSAANAALVTKLADLNRFNARAKELEKQPELLEAEIKKLKAEVERKQAGPEEAIVQIRPGGTGVDIDPTFVECNTTGLVIHGGPSPVNILKADITKTDGVFAKLLEQIAAKPKGQIIFLVRPDAVGTYNTARNFSRTHYGVAGFAKTGKLPVPSQGQIDLSVFKRS
ncbi:MAG: hypothetical protein C0478_09190 [Planctomyces sp.]|nr:hypothetical protein [Planctomyces sp.]